MVGKIASYNKERGFGWLIATEISDKPTSIFYHISQILDDIKPRVGLRVYFDVASGPRGLCAQNISIHAPVSTAVQSVLGDKS